MMDISAFSVLIVWQIPTYQSTLQFITYKARMIRGERPCYLDWGAIGFDIPVLVLSR
jgi:hypothetical protein